MHYRLLLETDFTSILNEHIRETRVLCLVAENVFIVWLQSVSESSFSMNLVYTSLSPWDRRTLLYGGLNGSMLLKQLFKDPEYAGLALNPTDLAIRESELRKKRRADWTDEERWRKSALAHDYIENQTAIQRKKIADNKRRRAAEKGPRAS